VKGDPGRYTGPRRAARGGNAVGVYLPFFGHVSDKLNGPYSGGCCCRDAGADDDEHNQPHKDADAQREVRLGAERLHGRLSIFPFNAILSRAQNGYAQRLYGLCTIA